MYTDITYNPLTTVSFYYKVVTKDVKSLRYKMQGGGEYV